MQGAQAALHKINEQLECPVCLETYSDPRVLPCLHSFCCGCVEEIVSAKTDAALREQPTVHVTCPVCRKGAALPNGPKSLPINFLVNGLLDALALTEAGVEEQSPNSGKVRFDVPPPPPQGLVGSYRASNCFRLRAARGRHNAKSVNGPLLRHAAWTVFGTYAHRTTSTTSALSARSRTRSWACPNFAN
jgi:hypothetical protein